MVVKGKSGPELLDFITTIMAMSANYQPVVIRALVQAGGRMPARDLAEVLLVHEPGAVDAARRTLMRWPKRTLQGRGIAYYDRKTREFVLPVYFDSEEQRQQVIAACTQKIKAWERAEAPRLASQRYRIIEKAGGRCQACGIPGSIRLIDVDHIVPRNQAQHGMVTLPDKPRVPVDDDSNLQALCEKCNRGKRDTSAYDFRPSAERLAETITLVLRTAAEQGYDPAQILAPAREYLDSLSPPLPS
jgi:5-methylcytosine-specific restriction endonuclease McrA